MRSCVPVELEPPVLIADLSQRCLDEHVSEQALVSAWGIRSMVNTHV